MREQIAKAVAGLRSLLERPLWTTPPEDWRPAAHLCGPVCTLWCALSLHMRLTPEGKCRCCSTSNMALQAEAATTRDHSHLTTGWWKERTTDEESSSERPELC